MTVLPGVLNVNKLNWLPECADILQDGGIPELTRRANLRNGILPDGGADCGVYEALPDKAPLIKYGSDWTSGA